MVGCSF